MNELEDYNDEYVENEESDYEEMDMKIINFIKMLNNQENEKAPNPSDYTISTQSGMAYTENITSVNLSKYVTVTCIFTARTQIRQYWMVNFDHNIIINTS